jgi:hypothetical protein
LEGDINRSIEYKREVLNSEHHTLRYTNHEMKITLLFAAVRALTLPDNPDFNMDEWLEENCEKSGNNWNCNFER